MAREYKPITLFTSGGNAEETDRDFTPAQERIANAPIEAGNYTADQMVRGDHTHVQDVQVFSDELTPEIVDPKDPVVVEPVKMVTPPQKENKELAKPPAK